MAFGGSREEDISLSTIEESGLALPGGRTKVVIVLGATATGKSQLGVRLAHRFQGEVVSADSMQVYRGMDVGTAKLSTSEMESVPHHLIDIANPKERFTVADWVRAADTAIAEIVDRGHVPIVVGGTGLYLRGITEDMDFAVEAGSSEIREKWERYVSEQGNERLHAELAAVDALAASRIHPNDTRRVIRALEVFEQTSVPLSEGYAWLPVGGRYETLQIGISWPRDVLYARVEQRVDAMLAQGLVAEVEQLFALGLTRQDASMQAIGYKEMASYVEGEVSYDVAVAQVKQATRRFVKRQGSWFARYPDIHWFSGLEMGEQEVAEIEQLTGRFLRQEL
jgi:tRNA dimethylallyltransferase